MQNGKRLVCGGFVVAVALLVVGAGSASGDDNDGKCSEDGMRYLDECRKKRIVGLELSIKRVIADLRRGLRKPRGDRDPLGHALGMYPGVSAREVSNDQGGDLILSKSGRKICVQAKRRKEKKVGNEAIRDAYGAMPFYECSAFDAVTNSKFTRSAKVYAAKVGCKLIDGNQIHDLVDGKIVL